MKKVLATTALALLLLSVFVGTRQYKEQTGQGCGEPTTTEERVNWFWQWWPNRDDGSYFIQCVGPVHFVSYRPLDVAGAGILIAGVLLIISRQRI